MRASRREDRMMSAVGLLLLLAVSAVHASSYHQYYVSYTDPYDGIFLSRAQMTMYMDYPPNITSHCLVLGLCVNDNAVVDSPGSYGGCCDTVMRGQFNLTVTVDGKDMHVVHYFNKNMYQVWEKAECKSSSNCAGKCSLVYGYRTVLVSDTPVVDVVELRYNPSYWRMVRIPTHCKCV